MYRKSIAGLVLVNLLFLLSFFCMQEIQDNMVVAALQTNVYEVKLDETMTAEKDSSTIGIAVVAASGQRVVNCQVLEKEVLYDLDESDLDVLYRIVEAEAGNEDEEGKLLVANVVLNRLENEHFPDTVREVVYQQSQGVYQFSPVASGRINRVTVSEETMEAVDRALDGEDISEGALFFASRKYAGSTQMAWFDNNLTYLFQHGGHEFYTRVY